MILFGTKRSNSYLILLTMSSIVNQVDVLFKNISTYSFRESSNLCFQLFKTFSVSSSLLLCFNSSKSDLAVEYGILNRLLKSKILIFSSRIHLFIIHFSQ